VGRPAVVPSFELIERIHEPGSFALTRELRQGGGPRKQAPARFSLEFRAFLEGAAVGRGPAWGSKRVWVWLGPGPRQSRGRIGTTWAT